MATVNVLPLPGGGSSGTVGRGDHSLVIVYICVRTPWEGGRYIFAGEGVQDAVGARWGRLQGTFCILFTECQRAAPGTAQRCPQRIQVSAVVIIPRVEDRNVHIGRSGR